MRTRSWPHILLNNGPGEVLLHTNRRWIGWCADLKLKTSRDSSYFMVLCQVCRCFHGFPVFPVFSTRRYRSNHTAPQAPPFGQFQARLPGKEAATSGGDPLDHDIWWGIFGHIFLGCLKQQQFPPVWPFFNSIRTRGVCRFIYVGQSKKSFKPSGGTYLEGASIWKSTVGWNHGETVLMGENMGEKNPWRVYICLYIYTHNIYIYPRGSTCFNDSIWWDLVHQDVISMSWESLWEASTVAVAENSFWSKATTWWVWHGESTWNLSIWLMWPFGIFP